VDDVVPLHPRTHAFVTALRRQYIGGSAAIAGAAAAATKTSTAAATRTSLNIVFIFDSCCRLGITIAQYLSWLFCQTRQYQETC